MGRVGVNNKDKDLCSRLEMKIANGLIGYSLTNSLILCFLPSSLMTFLA